MCMLGVSQVVINDLLPAATQAAMENVVRNGVSPDRFHHFLSYIMLLL